MLSVTTLNYNDLGWVVQTAATLVWPLPERPVNQGRHDLRDTSLLDGQMKFLIDFGAVQVFLEPAA